MNNKYLEKIAFLGLFKKKETTPYKRSALEEFNDGINEDMIDYVDKVHPELNEVVDEYSQIDWGPLHTTSDGKMIGVRMLEPKYDKNDKYVGTHKDIIVIHPDFQKQFGHLHLKDAKVIEGDSSFRTNWP